MSNITPILLMTFFAILGGCAHDNTRNSTVLPDQINNKAIVVTRVGHLEKGWLMNSNIPVKNVWAKIDPSYFTNQKVSYNLAPRAFSFGDNAYMVEPGTYVLDEVFYSINTGSMIYSYGTPFKGLSPDLKPLRQTFQVKAGEVIYIGDINMEMSYGKLMVQVSDKFEKAQQKFKGNYPMIKAPLEKRLIESPKDSPIQN